MAVPWMQIVQWVPSILEVSRQVLRQNRQQTTLAQSDPDDPLPARVTALEENQRRSAELLNQMAEHTSQLALAVAALHKQMKWMMVVQVALILTVVVGMFVM